MQTDQQTKIWGWRRGEKTFFPPVSFHQKPFSTKKSGFKVRADSTERLTNRFINLIMTNGEKEKAFKNLQITLFYLNQRRIGKGTGFYGVDFKGTEKRKFSENSLLPDSEKEKRVLQLPAKSLKNTFSLFPFAPEERRNSKNKVFPLEFNSSLLSLKESNLESPLNKKDLAKIVKKEKGWFFVSKEKETLLFRSPNQSEKRVVVSRSLTSLPLSKSPVVGPSPYVESFLPSSDKGFAETVSLKQVAFQRERRKVEKESLRKEESTFLLESTLLSKQQTFSSVGEKERKGFLGLLFLYPQTLSFREFSLEGKSISLFSAFSVLGSQKECPECLLKEIKKVSFKEKRNSKTDFLFSLSLSCRESLFSSLSLWACFKSVKNGSSQGVKGSAETDFSFLKQSSLSVGKEKQKRGFQPSPEDSLIKITKKSQKPIPTDLKEYPQKEMEFTFSLKTPFHLRVLYKGVSQISPLIEVRKVRKGGNTFQVPAFLKRGKGEKMGLTWLIEKGREKSRKSTLSFSESLSSTLLQSFEKSGETRQKRDQLLRLALSNRPYSRFRWW